MFFKKRFLNTNTPEIDILKQVNHFLCERENITMLWLPGGGRTTLGIEMQNKRILERLGGGRHLKKIYYLYVDLKIDNQNNFQLDRYLNETLGKYSTQVNLRNKLNDILSRGNYIYFILDNISLGTIQNLQYLLTFRSLNSDRVKFVYMLLEKDFYEILNSAHSFPSSIFHNFIKVPYFSDTLTFEWLPTVARSLKLKVDKQKLQKIYSYCGGIPVLLKNFLRISKKYNSYEETIGSMEMVSTINLFWKSYNSIEKNIIISAYKRLGFQNYPVVIRYLWEHKLLNNDYSFTSEWIRFVNS